GYALAPERVPRREDPGFSIVGEVGLNGDLEQLAPVAAEHGNGDALVAVLATEPAEGARLYLCAFEGGAGARTWIALDGEGRAVTLRCRHAGCTGRGELAG